MSNVFGVRGGVRCAALHKLLDYEGVNSQKLSDAAFVRKALEVAAQAMKATQLYGYYHTSPDQRQEVTAFLVLTEGHIAAHTWPDAEFVTLDILLTGVDLDVCVRSLKESFQPRRQHRRLVYRGRDLEHRQGDLFIESRQRRAAH